MGEEAPRLVTVGCTHPGGLDLVMYKKGYDDGTGVRPMVVDQERGSVHLNGPDSTAAGVGDPTGRVLSPTFTEVDEAFMNDWLKQNERSLLVQRGVVFVPDGEQQQ